MLDADMLRALMTERGYDSERAAKALKISPKSFESKLKRGDFGLDEANALIKLLGIRKPEHIFFPQSNSKSYE